MDSSEQSSPRGLSDRTKKLLIIIGIIGAVIIGALLMYGVLVSPARQPYRDAYNQYKNVGRANAEFTAHGASLNASTATDEAFEKSLKATEDAIEPVKKENEALGKMAVLQEGEGKALYAAFDKKLAAYLAYNDELMDSMRAVRPALLSCNSSMANVNDDRASLAALNACLEKLNAIDSNPNEDYKALVETFKEQYGQLAATTGLMVALADPTGADRGQHSVYADQREQLIGDLMAASKDFSKNLQQHRKAILTTDVAKELSDYLEDKSRIF